MTSGEHSSRPPRLYVTWYRCAVDSLDHAVTDEEFAHGIALQEGRYHALCNHEVLIDSCLAPPGRPCTTCNALIRHYNRLADRTAEPEHHPEPSRWHRLFGHLQTPAVPQPRPPQRVRPTPERDGRTPTSGGGGG
ncbi:MAG: hypothetical protein QOI21_4765, partial [Actinomycetota bacterium]|nr:hypothetical protein [Actinomycetota bacterium]